MASLTKRLRRHHAHLPVLVSRRHLPNHANVRSTVHRIGNWTHPFDPLGDARSPDPGRMLLDPLVQGEVVVLAIGEHPHHLAHRLPLQNGGTVPGQPGRRRRSRRSPAPRAASPGNPRRDDASTIDILGIVPSPFFATGGGIPPTGCPRWGGPRRVRFSWVRTSAHRLPVALPAQGLPAQEYHMAVLDEWRHNGTLDTLHDRLRKRFAPRRSRTRRGPPPAWTASRWIPPPVAKNGDGQCQECRWSESSSRRGFPGLAARGAGDRRDVDDAQAAQELFPRLRGSRWAWWCGCSPMASTTTSPCTSGSRSMRPGIWLIVRRPEGSKGGPVADPVTWSGRSRGWASAVG